MITTAQAQTISDKILPKFNQVLAEYNYKKYPAQAYVEFQNILANPNQGNINQAISDALRWKWGHWGKTNFPTSHRNLINEICSHWPEFACSGTHQDAKKDFDWWRGKLGRGRAFISVAFLTHLMHGQSRAPIIDQHNFRSMNYWLNQLTADYKGKRAPSQWQDIQNLKAFMDALLQHIPYSSDELDKYLMMHGRSVKVRK